MEHMPIYTGSCFQWFKDTNLRADHNGMVSKDKKLVVVFNGSKILIWEQITTSPFWLKNQSCCFQWFKDTNLRANHNGRAFLPIPSSVVSNGSKILIWKQITTRVCVCVCVFNGSKILIWKQIILYILDIIYDEPSFISIHNYALPMWHICFIYNYYTCKNENVTQLIYSLLAPKKHWNKGSLQKMYRLFSPFSEEELNFLIVTCIPVF